MELRGRIWIWAGLATAAVAALLWLLLGGDTGDAEKAPGAPATLSAPAAEPDGEQRSKAPGRGDREPSGGEEPAGTRNASRPTAEQAQRRATRAYRAYIGAINARDGAAACAAIEPGFLSELRPPVRRGPCAAQISGSIGFADERGFPVWQETILGGVESARIGAGERVQLTAAIVTRFADRDEPSVESDVAYLAPAPGGYRLVKASGALWRAVGKPDVPPQVIAEPPGFG